MKKLILLLLVLVAATIAQTFASVGPSMLEVRIGSFDQKKVTLKTDVVPFHCTATIRSIEMAGYQVREDTRIGVIRYSHKKNCEIIKKSTFDFMKFAKNTKGR